jgi:hypothetical protein
MSTRIAAKGAIIKHAATATPTVVLAGVRSVAITTGSRQMINATCHDSSAVMDFIPAPLRDTDSLDVTLAYDPADTGHEAIRAVKDAGTLYYLTLILPDSGAASWAQSGYVTSFSVPALNPETGILEATFSFKASAAATFSQ